MCDDVILIGHGLPLPVLLLYILLQVKAALLRNIVLLEECLETKDRNVTHGFTSCDRSQSSADIFILLRQLSEYNTVTSMSED